MMAWYSRARSSLSSLINSSRVTVAAPAVLLPAGAFCCVAMSSFLQVGLFQIALHFLSLTARSASAGRKRGPGRDGVVAHGMLDGSQPMECGQGEARRGLATAGPGVSRSRA